MQTSFEELIKGDPLFTFTRKVTSDFTMKEDGMTEFFCEKLNDIHPDLLQDLVWKPTHMEGKYFSVIKDKEGYKLFYESISRIDNSIFDEKFKIEGLLINDSF